MVATPIGNLEDLSARAVRILGEVSAIAAEDTRVTSRLLARHGIRKSLALIAESLPERSLTVTRELTKVHEEVLRGTASNVLEALGDRARGEFTLVFAGA